MKFGKKYSKKIILLRYEDFCLDPYGTLDRLVDFLNYKPIPKLIDNHVEFHTGRTRSGEQIEIPICEVPVRIFIDGLRSFRRYIFFCIFAVRQADRSKLHHGIAIGSRWRFITIG